MSKKNSFKKNALQDKWMDGIGEIADSYILEAVNYSAQKRMSREYMKVASIILLCICASVSILLYRGNLSMEDEQKTVSVGDGQKADSVGDGQKTDSVKEEKDTVAPKSNNKAENTTKKLPAYQYTGKDEIKKAIYNYVAADENGEFDSDIAGNASDVLIPHLMKTYGTFDEGDRVVFFGHLCRMYYTKSGDILKSTGGESLTFKAVLQTEDEGYSVKEFEVAKGDGSRLWDSVKKMMKGYPEAKRALEESMESDDDVEKERKRVIRRYVKDNDLKIRYYKDYGWDKVKL